MRKINIFNRHTNSASYRGNAVSPRACRELSFRENAESPRCCRELVCGKTDGEIPPFGGMTGRKCGLWWFAIIAAILIATPSFATDPDPAVIDRQIVASKAYVDTKQDIIETGLVEYTDAEEQIDYNVPALVSYGTGTNNADGVLGNKIGIVGMNENMGGLNSYDFLDLWDDEESGYLDNFVPTVRAVSKALAGIDSTINDQWQILNALSNPFTWDSNTFPAAINAYSVTFDPTSTHVNGNWPYNQQNYLVRADTFVKSIALKQNKLPEQNDDLIPGQQFRNDSIGKAASVLAPTTAGNVTQVALWDADYLNSSAWDIDDFAGNDAHAIRQSIPTVGAVEAGLEQKQNKMTCAGWDSETHTDEHCWLWSIE